MYLKETNGEIKYPYTSYNLRQDNPETAFGNTPTLADFLMFGAEPVQTTAKPTFDSDIEYLVEGEPIKDGDIWRQVWTVNTRQVTQDELLDKFKQGIQQHMDEAAQAAGYDDIKTAVTYAEEPAVPQFQIEGKAFREWRSLCWAFGYQLLGQVMAGDISMPTMSEVISQLPTLNLNIAE